MKNIFAALLLFPLLVLGQSTTQNKNYVKSKIYKVPSTGTVTAADTLVSINYYDGLARPQQAVAVKAGGQGQDVVMPIVYDAQGRQSKTYLPFAGNVLAASSLNYRDNGAVITSIEGQYKTKYPGELSDSSPNPYSEVFYDNSPLSRVIKQGAPGQAWMGNATNDNDHTVKYGYDTNVWYEVRDFRANFETSDTEKPHLYTGSSYSSKQLYKNILKDENWIPADGNNKTTEEFRDKAGKVILKRAYNQGQAHDTYYVYDKFSNLTYVIPPLASDNVTETSFTTNPFGRNYAWTSAVNVDAQLALDYEKALQDYDNADILNADLMDKYGGQGGFSIASNEAGELTVTFNISTTRPMELRAGVIADLKDFGKFPDKEQGLLKGTGYEYYLLIRNNALVIQGKGSIPSFTATFTGTNKLEYSKNYPWTTLCKADAQVARDYDTAIAGLDNAAILTTFTPNPYNATGGVAISLGSDDTVTIGLNIATDTAMELSQGAVIPLDIKRRLPDMDLGQVTGDGYDYKLTLKNNSLTINGTGFFNNIGFTASLRNLYTYTVKQEVLEGLCYIYHYDSRNRVIERKVPGKGWEHIVYDKLDRPVLMQDANMRLANKWLFTKYDRFNRVAYTGEHVNTAARSTIQQNINLMAFPVLNETRVALASGLTAGDIKVEYSNNAFPTGSLTPLTVSYYDDYSFNLGKNAQNVDYTFETGTSYQPLSSKIKSMLTGTKVRVLDDASPNKWITTYMGYSDKAQRILTYSYNPYLTSRFVYETQYNFMGNITETKTQKLEDGTATIAFKDYYAYDTAGRLLKHTRKEENKTRTEVIAWNRYDEFGKLIEKKVGGATTATVYANAAALQTVNYSYNIRGWLRGINNVDDDLSLAANTDLFAYRINYNTVDINRTVYPNITIELYNGNVAETHWKTKNDNIKRTYAHKYDDLNRLVTATYTQASAANTSYTAYRRYNEGPVTYDKNGNILSLERYGEKTVSPQVFDKTDALTYTYEPFSNRLQNVTDAAYVTGSTVNPGFRETPGSGIEYEYDANGNITRDANKQIGTGGAAITTYNYLDLPKTITFAGTGKKIEYVYDATGNKLKKTAYNGTTSNSITTTEYDYGYVYLKTGTGANTLQFFGMPEGYATKAGTADIKYIYQYKDQTGNVRLSYTDNDGSGAVAVSEIVEEANYYPFGLKHTGYNNLVPSIGNATAQKWKYNDREFEALHGLNVNEMNFRQYDPALGRFGGIDALAGYMPSINPYQFGFNNPVYFSDPTGLFPDGGGEDPITWFKDLAEIAIGAVRSKRAVHFDPSTIVFFPRGNYSGGGGGRRQPHSSQSWTMMGSGGGGGGGNGPGGVKPIEASSGNSNTGMNDTNAGNGGNPGSSNGLGLVNGPGWNGISGMELLQAILDILGVVPVIGEPADLLNASIYTANGDYTNAAISTASTVPIAGWFAATTKFAGKTSGKTLYRAVSDAELKDISANGFRSLSSQYSTGKLFATSAQDASNFGRLNYGFDGQPFTIIKTSIPNNLFPGLYKGEMDMMQAISVPSNLFNQLSSPSILHTAPIPSHPWIKY